MNFFNNFLNKNNKYNISSKFYFSNFFYSLSGVIVFIVLWVIVGKLFINNSSYREFSGLLPLAALKALLKLFANPFFWNSVLASINRIVIGLLIASVVGIPIGLIIGFYRGLRELTNIPIQFLRMISPLSWMPIAIILLPSFGNAVIFIITITSIWPIVLNTAQGVMNVQPEWIKMAKNQGAEDYQLLFKVIFPSAVPYILAGFRLAIGVAWIVLVPAEFWASPAGLDI